MKNIEQQIINVISTSQSILIMPSSPPDGDSLGSAIALYLILRKLNKQVTVVCADPIPDVFQFLPMVSTITNEFVPTPDFIVTLNCENAELATIQSKVEQSKINIIFTAKAGRFSSENVSFSHGPNKYDLIITVDTAAPQQLGKFYQDNVQLFSELPVINIDHHPSNEQFGRINYVDVMSSSTTELVLGLIEAYEESQSKELIDEDIATLLLAGIITDTGSFQHSNTSPRSFANSAKLIKRGAKQQEIIQHVYKTKQLSTLRLWGRVLTNIRIEKDHRFLWSVITHKDLADTGSKPDESGDIIDELMSNAPDTDIILLLKEKDGNILSGSIRTTSDSVDASHLASYWGGGGHARAAGFKIVGGDFAKSGQAVIDKIKSFQSERLLLEPKLPVISVDQSKLSIPSEKTTTIKVSDQKPTATLPQEDSHTIKKISPETKRLDSGILYKFE